MNKGREFLESQVDSAVVLHRSFVDALRDHEGQSDDPRFRELCARYMPIMKAHQKQLEAYRESLGSGSGIGRTVMGRVAGAARELADVAREDDFFRLADDIVMSDQAEDTFRTFREAGRTLGIQRLAQLGELGERQHDDYNRDANQLAQAMFVEHARGSEGQNSP